MIVVFDSDVLIPLILPASRSTRLLARLRSAGHKVALAPLILDEVADKLRTSKKLRKWLQLPDKDIEQFLSDLPRLCLLIPGQLTIAGAVPADPKDDKILGAAKESGAAYVISEDRHLRKLDVWEGIKIMKRDEFMAELNRLELKDQN